MGFEFGGFRERCWNRTRPLRRCVATWCAMSILPAGNPLRDYRLPAVEGWSILTIFADRQTDLNKCWGILCLGARSTARGCIPAQESPPAPQSPGRSPPVRECAWAYLKAVECAGCRGPTISDRRDRWRADFVR